MDAQRTRRTRDQARKTWYAHYRQIRFARWFGFIGAETDLQLFFQRVAIPNSSLTPAPVGTGGEAEGSTMILDAVGSSLS